MGEEVAGTMAGTIRSFRRKALPGRNGRKELAKIVGCQPEDITSWERGFSIPNERQKRILAKTFNITLAKLNGDHNNRKKLRKRTLFSEFDGTAISKSALMNVCAIMRELMADTEDIIAGKPGYKEKAGRIREVRQRILAKMNDE